MTSMAMPTLFVYEYVHSYIKSERIIILARRPRNSDWCPRNREIVWTYSAPNNSLSPLHRISQRKWG